MTWTSWGADGAKGTGTTWTPGTEFVTVDGMPAVHFSGLSPNCIPN
jgi:hypothetical protein